MNQQHDEHASHDADSMDMANMEEHHHMGHDIGSMHEGHEGMGHDMSGHGDHGSHQAMMVADLRHRFWVSFIISIPILLLSPLIQRFFGLEGVITFTGDAYVLFSLSSAVFFYGGWPFLKGIYDELKSKSPGMMTLIALAITVAYVYSSAVVFGVTGSVFFWELATLIDVMLLGHWLEMRSIMAASSALEELAKLMPSEAHKVMPDGSTQEVPLNELVAGDKVLVKSGEKIPTDGMVAEGETSVNEAMLTGESTPVAKQAESKVIGGSVNGEGSITVEVQKTGKDSYLAPRIKEKKARQDEFNKSRIQLEAELIAQGVEKVDVATVKCYAQDLRTLIEEAELVERKTFLRSFIKRIVVDKDQVTLLYKLPTPKKETLKEETAVLSIVTPGRP